MFATVKVTRNAIKRKFIYNGYAIAFDGAGSWSFGNEFAQSILVSSVDNNSCRHSKSRKK